MKYLRRQEYTEIMSMLLAEKPLSPQEIFPQMKILHAEPGIFDLLCIEITEVVQIVDSSQYGSPHSFKGILPTGEYGLHAFVLNKKLEVEYGPAKNTIVTIILDTEKAIEKMVSQLVTKVDHRDNVTHLKSTFSNKTRNWTPQQLGYRLVQDELYDKMFDCRNVIPLRRYK